jgi:hypothetical protein
MIERVENVMLRQFPMQPGWVGLPPAIETLAAQTACPEKGSTGDHL